VLGREGFVPAGRRGSSPSAEGLVGAELHPLFAAGGLQGTGGQQDSVKETPDFAVGFSSACKQLSKVLSVCRFQWDFWPKAGKPRGVIQKTHVPVPLTLEAFIIHRPPVKLPQS